MANSASSQPSAAVQATQNANTWRSAPGILARRKQQKASAAPPRKCSSHQRSSACGSRATTTLSATIAAGAQSASRSKRPIVESMANRKPSQLYAIEPPVEPMLAKLADELPLGGDYIFEPKWDGFRALV